MRPILIAAFMFNCLMLLAQNSPIPKTEFTILSSQESIKIEKGTSQT